MLRGCFVDRIFLSEDKFETAIEWGKRELGRVGFQGDNWPSLFSFELSFSPSFVVAKRVIEGISLFRKLDATKFIASRFKRLNIDPLRKRWNGILASLFTSALFVNVFSQTCENVGYFQDQDDREVEFNEGKYQDIPTNFETIPWF